MNIGLVDVDGHNFPNFALMRLSAYYKAKGHRVEWAEPTGRYDKVLASKVFTFSSDYDYNLLDAKEIIKGGTGYDIAGRLPEAVEGAASVNAPSVSSVRRKDTFRPWSRWS